MKLVFTGASHVSEIAGTQSESGVFVADDFRDNLIIDRYDPCFVGMRASKKNHLRSENSEDAVSWNVFRSLRQIDPAAWLSFLTERAFGPSETLQPKETTIELWKSVSPPPSLLEGGDEGISEIDIVIENPRWVWFIEAKLTSDISTGTTTRPNRDQILRNLDVGSYYAGVRDYYFALLIHDKNRSPKGAHAIEEYKDFDRIRERLPHRSDRLMNLRAIGILTWSDLAAVLDAASSRVCRPHELIFAQRCFEWLCQRGIHPSTIKNNRQTVS
ncbi:MAG: hypothetical protein HYV59_08415 [Planctomycetes bacterium]|nr:hypothetical protein [Planctomycetota bacterium]